MLPQVTGCHPWCALSHLMEGSLLKAQICRGKLLPQKNMSHAWIAYDCISFTALFVSELHVVVT